MSDNISTPDQKPELLVPKATKIQLLQTPDGLVLRFSAPGISGMTGSMLMMSLLIYYFIGDALLDSLHRGQTETVWIFALAALANTAFGLWWVKVAGTAVQASISGEHFQLTQTLTSLSLGQDTIRLDKIQSFELDEAARIDKGVSIWRLALRLKDHDGLHYPFGQGYSLDELRWLQSELNACLVTEA